MVEQRRLKRVVKAEPQDASAQTVTASYTERQSETYTRDEGLVSLITGLKFDYRDNDASLKCPSCGEDIAIEKGQCPACHELIRAKDPYALEAVVLPVIEATNVVYVHLDVEAGHLRFIQRSGAMMEPIQKLELGILDDEMA